MQERSLVPRLWSFWIRDSWRRTERRASSCCGVVSMPIIGVEIALRSDAHRAHDGEKCSWVESHGNRIKIKIWSETPDSAFYTERALQWVAIGWNHMEMAIWDKTLIGDRAGPDIDRPRRLPSTQILKLCCTKSQRWEFGNIEWRTLVQC